MADECPTSAFGQRPGDLVPGVPHARRLEGVGGLLKVLVGGAIPLDPKRALHVEECKRFLFLWWAIGRLNCRCVVALSSIVAAISSLKAD